MTETAVRSTQVKDDVPAFSVHKGGTNQTGLPSGSSTKITWPTEEFDTNDNFASDKFTPTQSGKYLLCACAQLILAVTGSQYYISIFKNGSEFKRGEISIPGAAVDVSTSISCTVDANGSGDFFEIYLFHNSLVDKDLDGTSARTWFTGIKVD